MTIASKLALLQDDIVNARNAIVAKGGTITSDGGSSQLAQDIATIPSVVSGIPRGVDNNGVYGYLTTPFAFALPPTATSVADSMLMNAFKNCTTITSVDLSSLTQISNTDSMKSFCEGCTNLTSVDLSNLTTVSGSGGMDRAFYGTNITGTLDLSSLQTLSGTSFTNAFGDCPNISSIDLSSLTTLAFGVSMNGTFSLSANPTTTLPLASVTFTSLASISGTAPMRNIFARRDGLEIFFPAFNSNTFGQMTTYLDNIVNGAAGCTVHFPSNMQAIIGNWSSVLNGFGGTNTTVLFDLPATN